MSRIKNMSRGGYIVVGFLVALLLVPSGVAVAKALKYTGIEGSNGTTTTQNKADVTSAGQLRVAEADPNALFQSGEAFPNTGGFGAVATPPSSSALIITGLHIDTYTDPTPGSGNLVEFVVETGTSCSGSFVGTFRQIVNPGTDGEIDIPLAPGLAVPSGDALCTVSGGSVAAEVTASGYTIPATAVTAEPLHAAENIKQ